MKVKLLSEVVRLNIANRLHGKSKSKTWRYSFDGIDDYIDIGSVSFPIEFYWKFELKTNIANSNQMLIADDFSNSYYMRMDSDNFMIKLWIGGYSQLHLVSPIPLDDNDFHAIHVWHKSGGWFFSVDGIDGEISGATDQLPYTGISNLKVGTRSQVDRFFIGSIRNVDLNGQVVIPINNGWNSDGIIRNLGQGPDATAINFNKERWAHV